MEDRTAADHGRPGGGREGRHARPAAVHADRGDDARRPADDAAARPLRHPAPPRVLRRPRTSRAIVRRSAGILDVQLDDGGAWAIAARSRGTPRVANRLLKRVRDWAEVRGTGVVDEAAADAALDAARGRRPRPRPPRPRDPVGRLRRSSAAARSACRRSRSRSARRPTRSRTSTSPTCSSAGCCSARRAAASRPRAPTSISASRRRARPRRSSESTRGACDNAARICALPPESARASAQTGPLTPTGRGSAYPVLSAWLTSSSARTAGRARTHRNGRRGFRRESPGCREVRLRVPLRAARRLLPGAGRGVLRLRRRGPRDRLRARLLRADRPRRRARDRPLGPRGPRPAVRRTATITSNTVLEWGVRALGKPVEVNAEGDLPARATADLFPAYDDDGGLLLVLTPAK